MRFSIYRYNPETDAKPHMQDYELDIDAGNMMLLDAILLLKAQDETLSVRRSCREGVCGSDAMKSMDATGWPASRRCPGSSSRSNCARCPACR